MIPYWLALFAWIPVSFVLMADRNSARGFSLAFLLGLMFLPAKLFYAIPVLPDLDKGNVATIGILLGTIVFHPKLFDRFRLTTVDLFFILIVQLTFISAYTNDQGLYVGFSLSLDFLLNFALPVILARIHLGTPAALRTFLLTMTLLSVLYAPMAVWEFRFSPQFHTTVYGYFQHVFQQHFRGGFWRPIVFFYHALALGRFFAFCAFLALFPLRRDLAAMFGRAGHLIFLAPLLGLLVSQSLGPYMLFFLLCGGYYFVRNFHYSLLYFIPLAAYLWVTLVYLGFEIGYGSVDTISGVAEDRAASLEYRLIAIREYKEVIFNRPLFGHGGWGHGRIEGRATDSQLLIKLLEGGVLGALAFFGWWAVSMHMAFTAYARTKGTVLATRLAAVGLLTLFALSISVIDSALDNFVMVLLGGTQAISLWLATEPELPALANASKRPWARRNPATRKPPE